MNPRTLLRLEGFGVFIGAVSLFVILGGQWWLFLVLVLAPDLSMIGYLRGPQVGAMVYNAAHTYLAPLVLGALGWWLPMDLLLLGASIWAAHIGIDRLVGYGLKYPTTFADTHLSRMAPADPATSFAEPDPAD